MGRKFNKIKEKKKTDYGCACVHAEKKLTQQPKQEIQTNQQRREKKN